jgi:tetratricopeptide (TPR) repeat protein
MIAAVMILLLAQGVSPELRQHAEAGLKAKASGDLDGAIREFSRVAELAPELAAAHANLGGALFEKRDYGKAIEPLRRALKLNPDLAGVHQMLGTALLAQGLAGEAIPHLETVKATDLLGIALVEAGRAREAIDHLEVALTQNADDPDLLYYLGQAHAQLSRSLFARLMTGKGARTDQVRGEAAMSAGRSVDAEKHFRAALGARPDLRGVHLALGELYLLNADYAGAEKEFRAESQMAPASAEAAYKLGLCLANLGQPGSAVMEFERALRLRPGMPETALELGKALAATGRAEEAARMLERAVEWEPESALAEAAYLQLNTVYRKLGRGGDAARAMEKLQQLRKRR